MEESLEMSQSSHSQGREAVVQIQIVGLTSPKAKAVSAWAWSRTRVSPGPGSFLAHQVQEVVYSYLFI